MAENVQPEPAPGPDAREVLLPLPPAFLGAGVGSHRTVAGRPLPRGVALGLPQFTLGAWGWKGGRPNAAEAAAVAVSIVTVCFVTTVVQVPTHAPTPGLPLRLRPRAGFSSFSSPSLGREGERRVCLGKGLPGGGAP